MQWVINDNWKRLTSSKYDVVYNVAGIAHVKAAKGEGPLYYAINRDMVIDICQNCKNSRCEAIYTHEQYDCIKR